MINYGQIPSGRYAHKGAHKFGAQGDSIPEGPSNGSVELDMERGRLGDAGGRVKTNWSHAPFVATYRGFEINACECGGSVASMAENASKCSSSEDRKYWWDEPTLSELSVHQSHQLKWVRAHHMVYDYCVDTARFK
ncbi:xyloglucan endotransglucosylase/hydrolase protein 9-like [Senna tora]|uniref:Xyloglucan endotransglucosylase/hydrolase protein 9-like n=1 Tax=Senna tora TaxID=362788 RepID=A0A835CFZ9_9FABA|nr:xyloglucan endotransglucosylase/hydrolase protein 9-like [Senna tora]